MDEHWATTLDYTMLGEPDPKCIEAFEYMSDPRLGLNLVVFSNGPRKYVLRVLEELGLDSYFAPENVFAVTDVLPNCKPEPAAFEMVLKRVGADPAECVMVEDSMKNVRAAKALGMKTVLVLGSKEGGDARKADKMWASDAPDGSDPAVDAVVEVANEIGDVMKAWLGN